MYFLNFDFAYIIRTISRVTAKFTKASIYLLSKGGPPLKR